LISLLAIPHMPGKKDKKKKKGGRGKTWNSSSDFVSIDRRETPKKEERKAWEICLPAAKQKKGTEREEKRELPCRCFPPSRKENRKRKVRVAPGHKKKIGEEKERGESGAWAPGW